MNQLRRLAKWTATGTATVAAAAGLAACSSSGGGAGGSSAPAGPLTTPAANTPVAGTPAASTPAPAGSAPSLSAAAVATALNPCDLVPRSEASALANASFGPGKVEPNGSGKRCVYGGQTLNVFTVEVEQASDAATAQAYWTREQAAAEAAVKTQFSGAHISLDTANAAGIGDRAATVFGTNKISSETIGVSGIYVLKGTVFFAFQDVALGHAAPGVAAMEDQARTVLTRVP
jgi:hypothetical protein